MSPCKDDGEFPIWRTRDGEEIKYHDLHDDHLENIIAYLGRQVSAAWSFSSMLQGEHAIDAIDWEIAGLENLEHRMISERDRRKDSKNQAVVYTGFDWESFNVEG